MVERYGIENGKCIPQKSVVNWGNLLSKLGGVLKKHHNVVKVW